MLEELVDDELVLEVELDEELLEDPVPLPTHVGVAKLPFELP